MQAVTTNSWRIPIRFLKHLLRTRKENSMGLFKDLMSKIFSHPTATAAQPAAAGSTASAPAAAPKPASTPPASSAPSPGTTASAPSAAPAAPPAAPPPPQPVDVAAVLNAMAAKNPEKLDWKRSIVDLMKLVGMDSSFAARKQLAAEMHYRGDPNDSAAMNIWLHAEVMKRLAENGGKVPSDLLKSH